MRPPHLDVPSMSSARSAPNGPAEQAVLIEAADFFLSLQYGGGFATASSAKMHNNQTKSQEKNGRMM